MFQGYLINCAGLKEELKEAAGKNGRAERTENLTHIER
jgi:hypothetical protein